MQKNIYSHLKYNNFWFFDLVLLVGDELRACNAIVAKIGPDPVLMVHQVEVKRQRLGFLHGPAAAPDQDLLRQEGPPVLDDPALVDAAYALLEALDDRVAAEDPVAVQKDAPRVGVHRDLGLAQLGPALADHAVPHVDHRRPRMQHDALEAVPVAQREPGHALLQQPSVQEIINLLHVLEDQEPNIAWQVHRTCRVGYICKRIGLI